MSNAIREVDGPKPAAVVVGAQLQGVSAEAFEASLKELERLADTLGLRVIGRVVQKRERLDHSVVIGEGKLKELARFTGGKGVLTGYLKPGKQTREAEAALEAAAEAAKAAQPDGENDDDDDENDDSGDEKKSAEKATLVLVDHDLSPGQTRNLEKATGVEVMDRSMVILSIFQRHARTREARMQVEIAQLSYMAPRLRETGGGKDRQGGKGTGETALELDRRRIRDRIAELKRDLEVVKKESDTRRSRRSGTETPTVALVGYTNAGKSSLMRVLTGDEVYVADQLFATLDTTVRILKPESRPRILVSDTVGFIKKLPHDLVASFRSTLQEAQEAGLLLHLVDAADPAFRDQLQVTREVLEELGAGNNASLLVLNKIDKLSADELAALGAEFPEAFTMSTRNPDDVARLHARIVRHFEDAMDEAELVIAYADQRFVALLHERCRVLEERYEEDGTHVRVRAPKAVLAAVKREIFGPEPKNEDDDF